MQGIINSWDSLTQDVRMANWLRRLLEGLIKGCEGQVY